MIEYTYVDMDVALPRYGEGPEFSKVKKIAGCKLYPNR